MNFQTSKSGQVVHQTFSIKVDGATYPTPEAIALVLEAMKLDDAKSHLHKFSTKTRKAISNKYNISQDVMILQPAHKYPVRNTARLSAWYMLNKA